LESNLTAGEILDEARKEWDVYHINIRDYRGRASDVQKSWRELLGDHFINVESNDDTNVSDVITALAIKSYKEQDGGNSSQDNTPQTDANAETREDEVKTRRRLY
jgi:hypothetical protein